MIARAGLLAVVLLIAPAMPGAAAGVLPSLEQHDTAVGGFTQRRQLPELERAIVSTGRFAYAADRGLLWQVESPVESSLVIDADGVYQNGERVAGGRALMALRPLFRGLFTGVLEPLERDFIVQRSDDDDGWRLELVPRDSGLAGAIERIVIAGRSAPRQVVISGADGGRTELVFDAITYPDTLDEALIQAFDRAR